MTISLYDISIPVLIRGLTSLSGILRKAAAYADDKGIPHAQLIEGRLAADMAALPFQIQVATDVARKSAGRLSGGSVEHLSLEETEKTFEELQARIQKSIDFLQRVDRGAIDGREDEPVVMKPPNGLELKFTGQTYLFRYSLPNFFFHVTTAYGILRQAGVPLGKADYIGSIA